MTVEDDAVYDFKKDVLFHFGVEPPGGSGDPMQLVLQEASNNVFQIRWDAEFVYLFNEDVPIYSVEGVRHIN
ncbi:hypothetical protein CDAR_71731 [Caerostris darwini]|uniref:Uncharacterized protein n=1 Tax=Caerostris darwini TaxID=1538125 RepID=A0AAV4TFR0_9ARAC|nr:hypothetical protein CDAR_71731 [Caerostris darwini]